MTLNELINVQKRFDGNHKGKFCWDEKISDDNLEILEFLIIALIGEVGETSNIIKRLFAEILRLMKNTNYQKK